MLLRELIVFDKQIPAGPIDPTSVRRKVIEKNSANFSMGSSAIGWRRALAGGLYHTGLLRIAKRISRKYELRGTPESGGPFLRKAALPKFLILCYHRVGTGGVPLYSELSPDVFEAQMRFLKKEYRIVSLEQICQGLQEPTTAEPSVAITFDDGYRDVFRHAFPILRKYGIPATVFLIADSVDTGRASWYDRIFLALQVMPAGRLEVELDRLRCFQLTSRGSRLCAAADIISCLRKLPNERRKECCADLEGRAELPTKELEGRMLNWEQVQIMQNAGVTFGSHTVTHPVVSRLTSAEMEYELSESKKRLETRLGTPVLDFAFPFGHQEECGVEATGLLRRYGYRSAVTTVPGVNGPGANPFALRRIQIGAEDTPLQMFAFYLSKHFLFVDGAASDDAIELESISNLRRLRDPSRAVEGPRHA
jgi:peptidoglycan/xylan/chitin deacetylase (PgdA/CDA1 family)